MNLAREVEDISGVTQLPSELPLLLKLC